MDLFLEKCKKSKKVCMHVYALSAVIIAVFVYAVKTMYF